MAIVMDIDETVLDNSRYQDQLVYDDAVYERESWDRWIALRTASQSLGFHVAFITNRACMTRPDTAEDCPQKRNTLANLKDIGVNCSSGETARPIDAWRFCRLRNGQTANGLRIKPRVANAYVSITTS